MAVEPNTGPRRELGWFSTPNYGGMFDVLWICLSTIFLHCWTAVHPDILAPGTPWRFQLFDRVICLLMGVIAPEVFLYLAFGNWYIAKVLMARRGAIACGERGMTHIFYSIMGGYHMNWT